MTRPVSTSCYAKKRPHQSRGCRCVDIARNCQRAPWRACRFFLRKVRGGASSNKLRILRNEEDIDNFRRKGAIDLENTFFARRSSAP